MGLAEAKAFQSQVQTKFGKRITNPIASVTLKAFETICNAVPQAGGITITMPSAEDAAGFGHYRVLSDGNAAGTITVAFPTTNPNVADQVLTADGDFVECHSEGGAWVIDASVVT